MTNATVTETVGGVAYTANLILEREGEPVEVGRWEKRMVKVGRVFRVEIDGRMVGRVKYAMVTRERRTPGKRYVNARWQSPGWLYVDGDGDYRYFECYSRKDGVERIIRAAARK